MLLPEIFERRTFCETKILYFGRSDAVASVLAHNQHFGKGRELKPIKKLLNGRRVEQTGVTQTYYRRESECEAPSHWAIFL